MQGLKRGLTLVGLMLALLVGGGQAWAQVPLTAISDTVYAANGTPASGTVLVSWNAFTAADGSAIPAGSEGVSIGSGGAFNLTLTPNAGGTPMGSYYTAVYHLSDGTTSREYWVVPVVVPGGGPAKLAAIRNSVLPTSMAMQTVSKQYVDNAISAAQIGVPQAASPYVLKTGDTMTGPLVLPADPVSPLQAADKNYVDENITSVSSGLAGKVSLNPGTTQVVTQPTGTQLEVNILNGEPYATPYIDAAGNDGVERALASADCVTGCDLNVERTYPGTEGVNTTLLAQTARATDDRGGTQAVTAFDPLQLNTGGNITADSVALIDTRSQAGLATARPGSTLDSYTTTLTNNALTGGSNQYPESVEGPPYFKSTYGVLSLKGFYNTQGQHAQLGNEVSCYGVGDCLAGGQYILSEGGLRDSADEGTHPWDLQVAEDTRVFGGTCSGGCTTGSTSVTVATTMGGGTEGDGRFLIDKNPAKVLSTGSIVGGGQTIYGTVSFSGTSFPVSVFLSTAQAATSQPTVMAPGTVTLPIQTSGVTAGFATSTAALPASSGIACVADPGSLPDYEMAQYTVVDATHIQLALNKVHGVNATIAVGGLCGYGLEQTVDTTNAIRQVFPVIGSTSATGLYYAQASTSVVGVRGQTGGYLNLTLTATAISRASGVVTATVANNFSTDLNGLSLTVTGVADSSYDGTFTVTSTGPLTLTYPDPGPDSTSSGGTLSFLTGGFALYPMAEVLSVYDTAARLVDGTLTLAPNTVAWASGDAVEEPHYYQQRVGADIEIITQYVPRPIQEVQAGKIYAGRVGPGVRGWLVQNAEATTDYLGNGGTHNYPDDAMEVDGVWSNDFEVAATNAVLRVHCALHSCNRYDAAYSLFSLDSAVGYDGEGYAPSTSTVTWTLRGAQYSFSPTAFTASAINAGTLTASGAVVASGYRETLFTPASSSASCTAGQFADDANYHYVCVATNTWKRVALSSF